MNEPLIKPRWWIPPVAFAIFTLVVFFDVLLFPHGQVVGARGSDITLQFIAWRHFGFTEFARGNLPLWNPHVFGGAPFFAGFQSALLYPPNWLHFILPLHVAINWIAALHVFAAGWFAYLWCRRRCSMIGSIVAGTIFMFAGPYFLHVHAGHLPHVAVIVWIPLVLLAIDGVVETARAKWWLLGTAALSMQILAGHPQYVYYTGIIATVYFTVRVIVDGRTRWLRATTGFVAMYVAAVLITAVQLFPGLAVTGEMVRSGGLPYDFAATFSFPPENLLTLLAPDAFGRISDTARLGEDYFGRGYLWEMSLFTGVSGFVLALIGAVGTEHRRTRWVLVTMIAISLVLALGRHTPLYQLLFHTLPMYGSFRGTTKFAVFAVAFVSMLAAMGFDRLLTAKPDRRIVMTVCVTVAAIALLAAAIKLTQTGIWPRTLAAIQTSAVEGNGNELFNGIPRATYRDPDFVRLTAHNAAVRLLVAGAIAMLIAVGIAASARFRAAILLLPIAVAVEMIVFARGSFAKTDATLSLPSSWLQAMSEAPADARFVIPDGQHMNSGMYFGFNGLWGYDPGVLKRFAETIAFSQGLDPNAASQYVPLRQPSANIFRALRCRAVLLPDPAQPVIPLPPALPTAVLVRNFQVLSGRDNILRAFESPQFDPGSMVLLESPPDPLPVKGDALGDVKVLAESTDSLELRVQIDTPAVLLVTNNFAEGWRVRSLAGPTSDLRIQPANWTQQAIALPAGAHHLVIEYSPLSFRVGRWVTPIALVAFIVTSVRVLRRRADSAEPVDGVAAATE